MTRETKAMKEAKRPTTKRSKAMPLLDAVEYVSNKVEDSKLTKECLNSIKKELAYLAKRLSITENEALILSVAASNYGEWCLLQEYANYLDCTRLQLLHYVDALHSLRRRRIIRVRNNGDKEFYMIAKDALQAIREDRTPELPKITGLNIHEFFDYLNELCMQRRGNELFYEAFKEDVLELLSSNSHLEFVSTIKAFDLDDDDMIFFLWACNMLVSQDDALITSIDMDHIYDGISYLLRGVKNDLSSAKSDLRKKDLIRPINEDGMASNDEFELTPFVRNEVLKGLGVEVKKKVDRQLIQHTQITPKQLFYNPREERSLSQLRSLLEPEQFEGICSRLEAKGLRRGFACLFYGAPGTGKTETVLQLARQTGRDLLQVNVAEIKSMWVGESEKNIKALFDRYRRMVKEAEKAPILFFNEADAIISKRSENVERSVDKMENTIQNIILQEIENLEGILIATTNLTKNLDSAFERRFLYKIEFSRPSLEAKQAIWLSMLPSLSADDAAVLATTYDFSGGQIENIARKESVEEILTGNVADIHRLMEFCNEERLEGGGSYRHIGF